MANFGIKDRMESNENGGISFCVFLGKTHEDILVEYSLSFSFLKAGPQSLVRVVLSLDLDIYKSSWKCFDRTQSVAQT